MRALHARGYQPRHIVVSAAGNVEHDRLLEALRETGWEGRPRGEDEPAVPPPPAAPPPRARHVEREAAQTQIVFGVPTVP